MNQNYININKDAISINKKMQCITTIFTMTSPQLLKLKPSSADSPQSPCWDFGVQHHMAWGVKVYIMNRVRSETSDMILRGFTDHPLLSRLMVIEEHFMA